MLHIDEIYKDILRQSRSQHLVVLFPFVKSLVVCTDHSDILKSKSCKMIHFLSIHAVPGFWCALPRICLCLGDRMWFIVRLVGVVAREAVMFFLCCLSCAAAVLSSLLYVHPDMHPQASMPFIISFETFIWSLGGISPLDSWHSQWKTSLIYREAYSQRSRAQPSLRLAMLKHTMVYIPSRFLVILFRCVCDKVSESRHWGSLWIFSVMEVCSIPNVILQQHLKHVI